MADGWINGPSEGLFPSTRGLRCGGEAASLLRRSCLISPSYPPCSHRPRCLLLAQEEQPGNASLAETDPLSHTTSFRGHFLRRKRRHSEGCWVCCPPPGYVSSTVATEVAWLNRIDLHLQTPSRFGACSISGCNGNGLSVLDPKAVTP